MAKFNLRNLKVGIVGLGYVGLPLAVEFGKRFQTVGFDIKLDRVDELWFTDGANDFRYQPNYFLRAINKLHIGFKKST